MKRKSGWIKRKLFTVAFKDRPRRALLWKKAVYEEWFNYAKLHQSEGGSIPRAFGNLSEFDSFEAWWRHPQYGFELFCEPFIDSFVETTSSARGIKGSEVLLKVNLKGDREIVMRDVKALLDFLIEDYEYQSTAKFQPSLPMERIQVTRLNRSRQVWELTKEGKKQVEIVELLDLPADDLDKLESSIRRVQRYKSAYKASVKQVSLGTFP